MGILITFKNLTSAYIKTKKLIHLISALSIPCNKNKIIKITMQAIKNE